MDFWNFQISWNERNRNFLCDWVKFPKALLYETEHILSSAGITKNLDFEEMRIYASVDVNNPNEVKLRKWLNSFLDMQPSFRVSIRNRRAKLKEIHCKHCGGKFTSCPNCSQPLYISSEKGIDAAIITDLFSLFLEDAYDIGILLSSDSDFIPAVERLQEKGVKIVNAKWKGFGFELAKVCWASFDLEKIVPKIIRKTDS